MIKKYLQYIKEADEATEESPKTETGDVNSKYPELKEEIKKLIDSTIEKSGGEFDSFIEKIIKSPKDVKIEGLINDSDIYEFYLKFRNDIDEVLNDVNYFDEVPSQNDSFGLYEYLVKGTERGILEVVKMISQK
jgi:hypothetical protein